MLVFTNSQLLLQKKSMRNLEQKKLHADRLFATRYLSVLNQIIQRCLSISVRESNATR